MAAYHTVVELPPRYIEANGIPKKMVVGDWTQSGTSIKDRGNSATQPIFTLSTSGWLGSGSYVCWHNTTYTDNVYWYGARGCFEKTNLQHLATGAKAWVSAQFTFQTDVDASPPARITISLPYAVQLVSYTIGCTGVGAGALQSWRIRAGSPANGATDTSVNVGNGSISDTALPIVDQRSGITDFNTNRTNSYTLDTPSPAHKVFVLEILRVVDPPATNGHASIAEIFLNCKVSISFSLKKLHQLGQVVASVSATSGPFPMSSFRNKGGVGSSSISLASVANLWSSL